MKTKINFKGILVAASMFFVFVLSSEAKNNEDVRVIFMSEKKAFIFITNPEKQSATINIQDLNSYQNLYSDRLSHDKIYRAVYDLSGLPDGKYKLIVDFGKKTIEKEIELSEKGSGITNELVYFEPVFSNDNNKLKIEYQNPLKEVVSVSFTDGDKSFFTDNLPDGLGSFVRSYNLEKLQSGSYSVELSSGNKNYYYSFDVK